MLQPDVIPFCFFVAFRQRSSSSQTGYLPMILSGKEIARRIGKDIIIEPFNPEQLNPNSYNLRLHDELLVYSDPVLDMKKPNAYERIRIPEEGLVLEPNKLYLGRTMEYTATEGLVPML